MARTVQMQIRLEPELKAQSEAVLSELGLKPTEYVRMALRQLIMRKGLPFDARIPNAETIAALEESVDSMERFPSARTALSFLDKSKNSKRKAR